MTIKDGRNAALDNLKKTGRGTVAYVVEWLDGSFDPIATFRYEAIEEAEKKYSDIRKDEYPAFIRKYAVVPM